VPLNTEGQLTVNVSGSTHVIMDVNGYYSSTTPPQFGFTKSFTVVSTESVTGAAIRGLHSNTGGVGAWGVSGQSCSTAQDSAGVVGFDAFLGCDITGFESGRPTAGVRGESLHSLGVLGVSEGTTGNTYGVYGQSLSTTGGGFGISGGSAAGVAGVEASGFPAGSSNLAAGVLGASKTRIGVQGDSGSLAVRGDSYDGAGNFVTAGLLGWNGGGVGGPYGVFSTGNLTATGTKMFIEPHATDPSKVVRFVSLEGNESGTYFRGSAQSVSGTAVIPVPEEFRMVTDDEGLTVQLTPVGTLATMCVVSEDLNQIVVRSNRDVKFHYQVNGIRRAFKNFAPISEGEEFVPNSVASTELSGYPEEIQKRLIANGTYNADGTVNMETAERLGWAKAWREREEQAKAAAAANRPARDARYGERK